MSHDHLNLVDGQVLPSQHSRASSAAIERRLAHQRHMALTQVGSAHFGIWLELFRQTVQDITGRTRQ